MIVETRQRGLTPMPAWALCALYLIELNREELSIEEIAIVDHLNGVLRYKISKAKLENIPPAERTWSEISDLELLLQCKHLDQDLQQELAKLVRLKEEPSILYINVLRPQLWILYSDKDSSVYNWWVFLLQKFAFFCHLEYNNTVLLRDSILGNPGSQVSALATVCFTSKNKNKKSYSIKLLSWNHQLGHLDC